MGNGAGPLTHRNVGSVQLTLDLRALIESDPVSYFSRENRVNWARRVDSAGVVAFTWSWAMKLVSSAIATNSGDRGTTEYFAYTACWPLPVGRQVLADLAGNNPRTGALSFLVGQMPFDGNERAAIVIDAEVSGNRVEAFGLVAVLRSASLDGDGAYVIEGMKFRISGSDPTSAGVADYCREAGNWWRSLAGQKLASQGRPVGSTLHTLDEVKVKLGQFRAE